MENLTFLKNQVKDFVEKSDENTLQKLYAIVESAQWLEEDEEYWEKLTEPEKAEIENTLNQLDNGISIDHKTVMKKYSKWL